ncbi:MAG TPA: histidine kinase [Puia sp.]|nr:histidine kinase [Puia sp.]
MTRSLFVCLVLVICRVIPAGAQNYSYTHYDIQDGLAGTTAYCITQDADGLIWVGTETGVSRFDGTHFKNFTTADGLPDIEILQIFGDSHGRVWMAPFGKSICYYYRGRIHSPANDSLLRRIPLKGNIEGFAEDAAGNVLVEERAGLHLIRADGGVANFDSIAGHPIRQCTAICRSASGHFLVQEESRIWEFSGDRFNFFRSIVIRDYTPSYIALSAGWVVCRETKTRSVIESFVSGKVIYRPMDTLQYKHNTYSITDDSLVCFCEFTGVTLLDLRNGSKKRLLPGIQVSRAFRDRDGSLWFTSLDHGLYRLNSGEIRTVALPSRNGESASVWSMSTAKNSLWAGTDRNTVFRLSLPGYEISGKLSLLEAKDKISWIDTTGDEIVTAGTVGIARWSNNFHLISNRIFQSKFAVRKGKDEIIVGGYWGCAIYNIRTNAALDTLWRDRVTALCYYDNFVYLGTFSGLYRIGPERSVAFLGKDIPFLSKRITCIAIAPDHTLWVGSADDPGIIGVRNDSIVAAISQRQGLTSNICRTLLIRDSILWVGTDKGLNAIRLDRPGYTVTRYTSRDGLGSDMINTLFADSSTIYAGTPAGISFFDERKVHVGEPCRLLLLSVLNSGRERLADTAGLSLPYKQKNIRFGYAAISYRSAGNVRYRYRMIGLDSNWQETNETILNYPSIPSGTYKFQLQAINRFGVSSELMTIPFTVVTPFWNQWWFLLLELTLFLGATWLVAAWRIRRSRRLQEQKAMQSRRMAELEHIALQSQMNPHFIFNCLNSIQQFVFDQDMMATNEYISGFARLIRATLNHSSKSFITVAEEIDYLSDYLALEKMRFKRKMEYRIEADQSLDIHHCLLPPMLLQPYVENAVRHGLRHKPAGQGFIHIQFRKESERLLVTIRDNGIGRKKAREYKTAEHIEYQSKGMSLTAARIQMIQVLYNCEIEVQVEDLEDQGQPDGTRIEIRFPLYSDDVRPR